MTSATRLDDRIVTSLGLLADVFEAESDQLVDEIMEQVQRELLHLERQTREIRDLYRSVSVGEVETMVSTLRDPSPMLPVAQRTIYLRAGEGFAEQGLPVSHLVRLLGLSGRILIPRILDSVKTRDGDEAVDLVSMLRAVGHRSTSAISIASRAFSEQQQHLAGERQRLREDLVADILSEEMTDVLKGRARALAFSPESYVFIVVRTPGASVDRHEAERIASAQVTQSWFGVVGSHCGLIVPLDGADRAQVRKQAMKLAQALEQECDGSFIVALGHPYTSLDDLRTAFRESRSIADAAAASGLSGLVTDRDAKLARVVLASGAAASDLDELLAPLDASRSDLVATLELYLDSDLSVVRAAELLGIHRNTMSYRLELVERLLGAPIAGLRLALKMAILHRRLNERSG